MKNIPAEILEVGFDFDWSNEKLWALNLPVEDMPISELTWHFAFPFWSLPESDYGLKPSEVIADSKTHIKHFERSLASDLRYPIDVMHHKGRWVILDGMHRLVRAAIEGKETVRVRKMQRDLLGEIMIKAT